MRADQSAVGSSFYIHLRMLRQDISTCSAKPLHLLIDHNHTTWNRPTMSSVRSLRVRKHLNTLHRREAVRAYLVQATTPYQSDEEQARFLREANQTALHDNIQRGDELSSHIKNKMDAYILALPTTMPVEIHEKSWTSSKAKGAGGTAKVSGSTTSIPYTNGVLRIRVRDANLACQKVLAALDHVREHLLDLQHEPYPDPKKSWQVAWRAQIAAMSRAEQEDLHRTMLLDEEASRGRLERQSEGQLESARELEGGRGAAKDGRRANPFGARHGLAERGSRDEEDTVEQERAGIPGGRGEDAKRERVQKAGAGDRVEERRGEQWVMPKFTMGKNTLFGKRGEGKEERPEAAAAEPVPEKAPTAPTWLPATAPAPASPPLSGLLAMQRQLDRKVRNEDGKTP
ncbi:hypothetical protein LTR53_004880 [Teratosphaeriaceae sp. CCFEE 6253]|nr:hypothetical protein LTR53_004880 [Teratosphaeriaceae sp. CCFEE 6253]